MTTQFTCLGVTGTYTTYSENNADGQYNVPFTLIPNTAANLNVYLWNSDTSVYVLVQQDDDTNPWVYDPANNRVDFIGSGPALGTATLPDGTDQGTLLLARVTDVSEASLAQFTPGSSIRSQDLNDNFNKLGNAVEELHCNATLSPDDFDSYYWNKTGDTITSTEDWVSDNLHIATTLAGDNRWLNAVGGNVVGGNGIDVVEAGGNITINLDRANISGLEFVTEDGEEKVRINTNDGCEIVAEGLNTERTSASIVQTDGDNNNPAIRISNQIGSNAAVNTDLQVVGGTNVTVTRDSNTQVTIAVPGGIGGLTFRGTVNVSDNSDIPATSALKDAYTVNTNATQTAEWQTMIEGTSTTCNSGDVLACVTAGAGTAARYELIETGGINNLQQVTTAGNTTTNPIVFDDTSIQIQEDADTLTINWPAGTADHTISFPDASGTVALTSDITNTTYDLTVPAGTTDIRLAGSDGTNDDITLTAGANVTITRNSDTELTIASTGGGGDVSVEDDGSEIVAAADTLNFTGAGVTVTADGNTANIAIPGGGDGDTINYNGASSWGYFVGSADPITSSGLNYSITATNAGIYQIAFTTSMPNDDYSITVGGDAYLTRVYDQDADGFEIRTFNSSSNAAHGYTTSFAVFATNALAPTGTTGTDAWGQVTEDGDLTAGYNCTVSKTDKWDGTVVADANGAYYVTFNTAMPTANYAVTGSITEQAFWDVTVVEKDTRGFTVNIVAPNVNDGTNLVGNAPFDFQVNATNAQLPSTVTQEQIEAAINNPGLSAWCSTVKTTVNGPVPIANGSNVASVTRTGTGVYDIVFTTPMPNADYAVASMTGGSDVTIENAYGVSYMSSGKTANGFSLGIRAVNGAFVDNGFDIHVASTNALPPRGTTGADGWGQFDGTDITTVDGEDRCNITASYNIEKVVRTNTGIYVVHFTTDMPTGSYAVVGNTNLTPNNNNTTVMVTDTSTDTCTLNVKSFSNTFVNSDLVTFTVHATNANLPATITQEQIDALVNGNFWQSTGTQGTDTQVISPVNNQATLTIDSGSINFNNLPTADPAVAGRLWNDSGTLRISAG